MLKVCCIVGTDTEIGKTYVSCELLQYLTKLGLFAAGIKPLSAGVIKTEYGLINEDAYRLFQANNIQLDFKQINPINLIQAIAPHIAAEKSGFRLDVAKIALTITDIILSIQYRHGQNRLQKLCATKIEENKKQSKYDYLLIEGVGGIMVPFNHRETYLDLLVKLDYPVIMVVGMKLGCLNHALLTYQTLVAHKLNMVGWIANCVDKNMMYLNENIEFLRHKLKAPLIAIIPYQGRFQPMKDINVFDLFYPF